MQCLWVAINRPYALVAHRDTPSAIHKETAVTTQATQTNWMQDAEWLETQVQAMQFMLGTTLSNELAYQLRNAVMLLDDANRMVISYAVTVRNLATYTIEDVQHNRRVLQTIGNASNDLAKMVDKRQATVDTLQLLLTLALPVQRNADASMSEDIYARRRELAETICENAARRLVQA